MRVERVFDAVFLLLRLEDVHRALVSGEQVYALVGGDKRMERADAGDKNHEIVLTAKLEGGVYHVMPDALVAEVDLEAVSEEGQKLNYHIGMRVHSSRHRILARKERFSVWNRGSWKLISPTCHG